jgi:hypothetical protein
MISHEIVVRYFSPYIEYERTENTQSRKKVLTVLPTGGLKSCLLLLSPPGPATFDTAPLTTVNHHHVEGLLRGVST